MKMTWKIIASSVCLSVSLNCFLVPLEKLSASKGETKTKKDRNDSTAKKEDNTPKNKGTQGGNERHELPVPGPNDR
mgnify:CR=1 FL=1